ncbi:hypothetical protein IIB34_00785 [PVC group bacterium]|nr:hypothetical protein [PVC group bacterium]
MTENTTKKITTEDLKYEQIEFSTNMTDLKMDISQMEWQLVNGLGVDVDIVIENLQKIQYALACMIAGRSN